MKSLKIIWTIASNLITIFIVLALLSVTYTSFETATICLLILIYINVNSSFTESSRHRLTIVLLLVSHLKKIHKNKEEDDEEELEEVRKLLSDPRYFINLTGNFLCSLIAFITLLGIL